MAGRRNGDSDSRLRESRRKRRPGRSASYSPSRSPVRASSRSPSKRVRRGQEAISRMENEKDMERNRERDHSRGERVSDRFQERDNNSRHHAREEDLDGRHRPLGRERDLARGRDGDRGRGRDSNRDIDRSREREKGRERARDAERGKVKERTLSRERSPDEGRAKGRLSPTQSCFSRTAASSALTSLHHKKSHPSSPSPPHRALRTAAVAMRDEALNQYEEEPRPDGAEDSLVKMKAAEADIEEKQKSKEKPSFEYSGKLAAETNKVRGVTLQFTEPPEARKPTVRWRLYIFKDGEPFNEPLYMHRLSCYLFGRERRVADVPTDHPSCSKQHAVIQYRLVEKVDPDGINTNEVRPYLMDLGSTNGTFLNGERLESERYYELFEKDTIKFGNSREYVLLHEHSVG